MTDNKGKIDPSVLIEKSLSDFEVADILFDKKVPRYNPQAIFMLQQSLEKAIKAALVCLGLVKDEKELINKIGHEATKGTIELLRDKAKESIIDLISLTIQKADSTNKEKVWMILKDIVPALNNLKTLDETVEDYINKIMSSIFDVLQKIIRNGDDNMRKAIYLMCITNEIEKFIKEIIFEREKDKIIEQAVVDYVKNFYNIITFINTIQFKQYNVSLVLLSLYAILLIALHEPLDNIQAKLRYHLVEINEDEGIYRLSILIKEKINTQINNKNILENLKELINNFKDNQISNYATT
jgi:HEPN domain-containing protein